MVWHFDFFVNAGPHGALSLKMLLLPYRFHPMSYTLYKNIAYHGGIQGITIVQSLIVPHLKMWYYEAQ